MAILSTNHLYNEPKRRSSKLLSEIKFPYNSLPMLDPCDIHLPMLLISGLLEGGRSKYMCENVP